MRGIEGPELWEVHYPGTSTDVQTAAGLHLQGVESVLSDDKLSATNDLAEMLMHAGMVRRMRQMSPKEADRYSVIAGRVSMFFRPEVWRSYLEELHDEIKTTAAPIISCQLISTENPQIALQRGQYLAWMD